MAEQWPPPADDATAWREFTPDGTREAVQARQVVLWGQQVWIAELDGEWRVWCTDCRRFLSVEVLGRLGNGHAAGVRVPSGSVFRYNTATDDGPNPAPLRQFLDLMRKSL